MVPATASTNTDVAELARAGEPEGLVLLAESQLSGKGRLAREWISPPRAGLTFSMLLRPGVPPARLSWLSLLAGVALARTVRELCEIPALVKWPNDLLLGTDPHKGAGILAEVVPSRPGLAVVLGIGLNVTNSRDELPGDAATSLLVERAKVQDRDVLLRAVLRAIEYDYRIWCEAGGDPLSSGLLAAYRDLCHTLGRKVTVVLPGDELLRGEAVDIDDAGRLIVASETGLTPVAAGDVLRVR